MGDTTPLPEGWTAQVDPKTNHTYYISVVTGKSQWERPVQPAAAQACYPPWEPKLDPTTSRTYFYNTKTGESLWELPPQPATDSAQKAAATPVAAAAASSSTQGQATSTPTASPAAVTPSATPAAAASATATATQASTTPSPTATKGTTEAPLPPGWEERFDNATNHKYYVNVEKNITQWERPAATTQTPAANQASPAATAGATPAGTAESSSDEEEDPPLVIFRPELVPKKGAPKKKDKNAEPEDTTSATIHKLVVIGAGAVGKSALVVRFIKGDFIAEYDPTIEDSYRRQFSVDDRQCHLDILDTAGQEEYSALRDNYMRTGQGFLVVFAVNSRGSFAEIPGFVKHIHEVKDLDEVPLVVVGSKCDLRADVPQRVINDFCTKNQAPFIPCSAKSNTNVETVFSEVVKECRRICPTKANPNDSHKKCLIL
ncbi:hypothetical protein Pelo_12519 [Pelomyxa schiedti]|nr:hypothetical protein Pelo_12519 [Pelomyxa schiedti]